MAPTKKPSAKKKPPAKDAGEKAGRQREKLHTKARLENQRHFGLPEVMDMDEAAAYLRVSRTTVYKLAQAGKIPAFKVAGMWRFRLESLREWTEKLEREQRGK